MLLTECYAITPNFRKSNQGGVDMRNKVSGIDKLWAIKANDQ